LPSGLGRSSAILRRQRRKVHRRITGQPREIEIWFTEHGRQFYLVAERESGNWVRNILSQPQVRVRVGDAEFNAVARVVRDTREPQLAATVKALFDSKYGWSHGLIVELTPRKPVG
jgi:deazaflavin-dependent oxidoreductase (nitroreductase family)